MKGYIQSSKLGMLKGYHCVKNGTEKGVRGLDLAAVQRKKETGAKPDLNSSPITVASLAVLCFVPI